MSDVSYSSERLQTPRPSEHASSAERDPSVARPIASEARESLIGLGRKIEALLAACSDWFNPILVKETRQALRSTQFTITFTMLLVACWMVTIGGVAVIGPSVYYAAGGPELLWAYYLVLSVPLILVVPFAAFRSLAAEREDNTYELLSITTLKPRQIIGGKLASAVLQMMVYFSAVMPCLAFTYLLRGVDAPSIALLLVYTFLASLLLSMIGLLLATLSRQRFGHIVLSVGFVALLLYTCYEAQEFASSLIRNGYEQYMRREFWINNFFGAAMYGANLLLAYLAAAAMITLATENRSTPLRIAMLLQQAVFIGWIAYRWLSQRFDSDVLMLPAEISVAYWFVMGAMLNGEQGETPHRALRSLPSNPMSRLLFTWLRPGPASGYAFAVANVTTIFILCLLATELFARPAPALAVWPNPDRYFYVLVLGWSYLVAYLGLGCLVVALLRRVAEVTMFASVLLHLLLLLAGSGIPHSIHWMSVELQNEPYSYIHATDPIWTLNYILERSPVAEEQVLLVVVPAAAFCILLLNLPGLIRSLERTPAPLPARVATDEAELHPPPEALPQSPWDEEDVRPLEI